MENTFTTFSNPTCPKCGKFITIHSWGGTAMPPMCDCHQVNPMGSIEIRINNIEKTHVEIMSILSRINEKLDNLLGVATTDNHFFMSSNTSGKCDKCGKQYYYHKKI